MAYLSNGVTYGRGSTEYELIRSFCDMVISGVCLNHTTVEQADEEAIIINEFFAGKPRFRYVVTIEWARRENANLNMFMRLGG